MDSVWTKRVAWMVGSLSIAVLLVIASRSPAVAQPQPDLERITNEPAATLLLPYFEVQLPRKPGGKPKGINTLFSINNASATAILAHVTIWSDLAVPVTFFDVYLTGFDIVTINLAEILNGLIPITASVGQDPGDTISNHGPVSQDINFASCSGILPGPSPLPIESIDHLRASLTGKFSQLFNGCVGRDFNEKKPIARGFVTVDTVNQCSFEFPNSPVYPFILTVQNVLWGDYFFLNRTKKVGHSDPLVAIRAAEGASVPGDYTFYGRFSGFVASDKRQPLATNFFGRFFNDPKHPFFPLATQLIVWRDPKRNQNAFNCASQPPWFPLGQEQIVAFDEQENAEEPQLPPIPPFPAEPVIPFPAAAQIVRLGAPNLPVSFTSGSLFLNLNTVVAGQVPGQTDPAAAQAWVVMVQGSKSKYTAATRAFVLDSARMANHSHIDNIP